MNCIKKRFLKFWEEKPSKTEAKNLLPKPEIFPPFFRVSLKISFVTLFCNCLLLADF